MTIRSRSKQPTTRELAAARTFERAAKLVEARQLPCCFAISECELRHSGYFIFQNLFLPQDGIDYHGGYQFDAFFMRMGMDGDADAIRNRRVVALCLAAAVARSGSCSDFAEVE